MEAHGKMLFGESYRLPAVLKAPWLETPDFHPPDALVSMGLVEKMERIARTGSQRGRIERSKGKQLDFTVVTICAEVMMDSDPLSRIEAFEVMMQMLRLMGSAETTIWDPSYYRAFAAWAQVNAP
ncbi:hypothetical protein SAMN02990966_07462 [Rhodospirillales bacterium URHD0017]|nr:hypothetical protein SAMN02990966_07462 [Rhodospirillales bacterium URHD0017]